jgi:putative aldouronate transport system permease protein
MPDALEGMTMQAVTFRRKGFTRVIKTEWPLYLFLAPAVVVTIVFAYIPMFSNVIAFMDYNILAGWLGLESKFVGLRNFINVFNDRQTFIPLVWRTFYYSVIRLVTGQPAPFILALLINELRRRKFKRTVQTIFYLPHFVSWVTIASLTYWFLTTDTQGLLNNIRQMLGAHDRIIFMKYPSNFPWVLAITGIIKETGWGTIIYLAAISGVDAQLYEAAKIDGAGRWKQFVHVTFPSILPVTMILLILSFGSLFSSNFDQIYNLQNPIIQVDTNVINTYTYYVGVVGQGYTGRGSRYSVAAAVGLFQGVINGAIMLTVNWVGKKVSGHGFF